MVIFLITAVGMFKYDLFTSIFIAISLAVAAIPEGLPAIVVLTLAVAAKSMSKKNALIRRLAVTESIGSIDIICTDKTGTLTKNEMSVTNFYIDNISHGEDININSKSIQELIRCGLLCNNSRIDKSESTSKKYFGDQTEIAIRIFSEKFKNFSGLIKNYTRINEISFTSKRKMMSVIVESENNKFMYSKGAPEVLINKCNRININGKIFKLTKEKKKEIIEQNRIYASDALRVIGFAYKEIKNNSLEKNLIWIGLEAMIDPAKDNVKESISECITAGIKVIMLTGDNPETAMAIAKKVGLESTGVFTGDEIEKMTDQVLFQKIEDGLNIFARISPFDKLRILEILKSKYRVAMTGDGVNDALALKRADIGIAMGIRGTEVSKQASDMILLDDNFSTITEAVREGRRVFNNIRKFINYLFTCNFAEVGVLLFASLFLNLDSPALLPIHILWINLLTDGLPALALGIDPARKDIMKISPRKKAEGIMNKGLFALIVTIGTKKIIILSTIFIVLLPQGIDIARSALFTSFVIYEFVRIASLRQIEKLSFFSNKWLIGALFTSLLLQLIAIYSPLSSLLSIVPLSINVWGVILGFILIGYILTFTITKIVITYVK